MLASLQMPIRSEGAGIGVDKEAKVVESSGRRRAFALGGDERGRSKSPGRRKAKRKSQAQSAQARKPRHNKEESSSVSFSTSEPDARSEELGNANPRGAIREGARWMLQQRLRGAGIAG